MTRQNEIEVKLNLDVIYVVDSGIVASYGNGDKIKEITKSIDDRCLFVIYSKVYLIFENELGIFFMRYPFIFFDETNYLQHNCYFVEFAWLMVLHKDH